MWRRHRLVNCPGLARNGAASSEVAGTVARRHQPMLEAMHYVVIASVACLYHSTDNDIVIARASASKPNCLDVPPRPKTEYFWNPRLLRDGGGERRYSPPAGALSTRNAGCLGRLSRSGSGVVMARLDWLRRSCPVAPAISPSLSGCFRCILSRPVPCLSRPWTGFCESFSGWHTSIQTQEVKVELHAALPRQRISLSALFTNLPSAKVKSNQIKSLHCMLRSATTPFSGNSRRYLVPSDHFVSVSCLSL